MKSAIFASAAVAICLTAAPSWAAESADKMAGMQMSGPMNMGLPLSRMPGVYMGQADKPGAPVFKGLGGHRFPISTRNPDTQRYFDQGVNLLFGFNHAEAIRSFREAARLDPDCAMCWWGVAVALGPNINLPMPPDAAAPAWQALQRAQALAPKAPPREQAWIAALATRYSANPKADRHALDEAYAAAMGRLWREHPDDLDAGTFYAEAMMDTQPWDYWQADAKTPKGHGGEIVSTLETILAKAPDHPGALHLYIHAVEASTTPERAEAAADRLLVLMPEAGHVVHMPSHIYYRVGRYADAARVNELAAKVDENYIAACKAQGFYPAGYYGHNIHFLWTSSEMQGRYRAAIDAARRLVKSLDAENLSRQIPLGELYVLTPVVTQLRFGKWREVLAEPPPPKDLTLDLAIWTYAQGFAHANTGDLKAAQADRRKLAALTRANFSRFEPFGVPAPQMTKVALSLLDGEIARVSGDLPGAIAQFRAAAELEKTLPYTEPPYWHQPVSHLLGAALLQANRPAEAEAVYAESLHHYRQDGWALMGLAKALEAQGKTAEARRAQNAFMEAWRMSDTNIDSSRL
jgi:tetratricopeptide (TPR) repeat protein